MWGFLLPTWLGVLGARGQWVSVSSHLPHCEQKSSCESIRQILWKQFTARIYGLKLSIFLLLKTKHLIRSLDLELTVSGKSHVILIIFEISEIRCRSAWLLTTTYNCTRKGRLNQRKSLILLDFNDNVKSNISDNQTWDHIALTECLTRQGYFEASINTFTPSLWLSMVQGRVNRWQCSRRTIGMGQLVHGPSSGFSS